MRRFLLISCGLWVALAAAAGTGPDDRIWIEARPMFPDSGEVIDLRLVGAVTDGSASFSDGNTSMLQHVWNSGRAHLGTDDARSSRFKARDAGVHLIAYSSEPQTDPASGARVSHFGKLLLVVGDGAPDSPIRYSEVGQRLEIVPQTDPVALKRRGGRIELQVLYDREPLAGVTVRAHQAGSGGGGQATTDEIGLATLRLDQPGTWIVEVSHEQRCRDCGSASRERLSATLTLATR